MVVVIGYNGPEFHAEKSIDIIERTAIFACQFGGVVESVLILKCYY